MSLSSVTCNYYSFNLPVEIWEIIFTMLISAPKALVASSMVCRQWRHLVTRICQKFCTANIQGKLLKELSDIAVILKKLNKRENGDDGVEREWVNIFWLYHEGCLETNSEERFIVRCFESTASISTLDPFLIISTFEKSENTSTLHIFDSSTFPCCSEFSKDDTFLQLLRSLEEARTVQVESKVLKVCLLTLPTPVLLLITTQEMKGLLLPPHADGVGRPRECVAVIPTSPSLKGHPKTSSEHNHLVIEDTLNGDCLLVYEATLPDTTRLDLTLKCRLETEAHPYSWSLHRGLIRTMETSGHIRSYKIQNLQDETLSKSFSLNPDRNNDDRQFKCDDDEKITSMGDLRNEVEMNGKAFLYAESALKKDLRYPNPTVFTKDFLFSSTLVSRDLLGYWHMDRDRDYWLVGLTSPEFCSKVQSSSPKVIQLHQVMLGQEIQQVVTAVHFQRNILLCGTNEGHVIGYQLPKDFDHSQERCFEAFTRLPWLNITGVAPQSICRLGALFTPLGLLVAVGDEHGTTHLLYIQCHSAME